MSCSLLRLRRPEGIAIKSALVAVSGNSADEDAVRFAAQLTEPQHGSLYIVHVIEVERSMPVDSDLPFHTTRGDDLLDRMERTARPFKCEVRSELLQARLAGHAIVHEAVERNVDAVVIGMHYKTKYGSFALGEAVPYVLEHAPCRVILWRDERPEEGEQSRTVSNHSSLSEAEHGTGR